MYARDFLSYKDFFLLKTQKNNYSSVSGWWEYTKYRFKENAKILSTNSINQQNITISRKKMLFFIKNTKATSSASVWWGNINSSFKQNAMTFSKSFTTQENIRISEPKKKTKKFVQKDNFEPKIKSMIENLQNELYQ